MPLAALKAAYPDRRCPLEGAPPYVCFCNRRPLFIVYGSFHGVGLAFSLQLDRRPWNSSLRGYPLPLEVLPVASPRLYYTKPLLRRCCPPYRGLNADAPRGAAMAFPHRPVVARSASSPQTHLGRVWHRVPGWIHRWFWRRTSKSLVCAAPESMSLERVSSDVCRAYRVGGSILGSHAMMSGPATVTLLYQ
jgi:hypothetical protein